MVGYSSVYTVFLLNINRDKKREPPPPHSTKTGEVDRAVCFKQNRRPTIVFVPGVEIS
jgi:hypothetical protein